MPRSIFLLIPRQRVHIAPEKPASYDRSAILKSSGDMRERDGGNLRRKGNKGIPRTRKTTFNYRRRNRANDIWQIQFASLAGRGWGRFSRISTKLWIMWTIGYRLPVAESRGNCNYENSNYVSVIDDRVCPRWITVGEGVGWFGGGG